MELNICHLYPDLLNVYGDVGNILILKHRAENRGIKVNVINVSINDEYKTPDARRACPSASGASTATS